MTCPHLSAQELTALVTRVFEPRANDRALAVITDLPDQLVPDNPDWCQRRELAASWVKELAAAQSEHGLEVDLYLYRNARQNNADLPATAWRFSGDQLPANADQAQDLAETRFADVFAAHSLILAPTEFSATAPLKVAARDSGFRAATMPGFSSAMVPALRLDYTEVNRRVSLLTEYLNRAVAADLHFTVEGSGSADVYLDLRHRTAHASGGLLRAPGTAGNLPSGEAYIVPYEGELAGDPTASAGELPVQHGDQVVLYRIEDNRAVAVISAGPESDREARKLAQEPAYGNLAELGLGVLGDFGIAPIGEVLLDEKLGLHIAFGRSEHFGGQVGPDQFSSPDAVIHQDYVYISEIQPLVCAAAVDLLMADGTRLELIRNGKYTVVL